jgi:hypothetical protein
MLLRKSLTKPYSHAIPLIQQRFIKMAKSPFCSFPIFFRELLGFLLNWRKLGLKASDRWGNSVKVWLLQRNDRRASLNTETREPSFFSELTRENSE